MTTDIVAHQESKSDSYFTLEYAIKGLIFLFPIGAVTVKSWTSAIHVMLFILCLIWLVKYNRTRTSKLSGLELNWIFVLFAMFFWYLFSEYMNGWYAVKPHWPLIDLRYVLAVIIFLAIRNIHGIYKWFIRGVIIGAIITAFYAMYQYFYINKIPWGAYNILFFGPVLGLMGLLILYSHVDEYKSTLWKVLGYGGILCGLISLILSTARGGLLAASIVLALYPVLLGKLSIKRSSGILILLLLTLAVIFTVSKPLRDNVVVETVESIKSHYNNLMLPKEVFHSVRLNNITIRFELWKATIKIVRENPVYGISRAKIIEHFNEMILNDELHPQLKQFDQPHNAYLYYLVSRGIGGLGLFILFLFIPILLFFKNLNKHKDASISGLMFVMFFCVVSLTQSSVFLRGHYLSYFLVLLVVLLGVANNKNEEKVMEKVMD